MMGLFLTLIPGFHKELKCTSTITDIMSGYKQIPIYINESFSFQRMKTNLNSLEIVKELEDPNISIIYKLLTIQSLEPNLKINNLMAGGLLKEYYLDF